MFAKLEFSDELYIHGTFEKFKNLSISDCPENEFIIVSDSEEEKKITVLSIDVGIRHLALVLCQVNKEYKLEDIVGVDMVDITTFPHHDESNCNLYHKKTFADWMSHIFQYYDIVFSNVDHILVERQPPKGLVAIEQLIYFKYRDKTHLISPNSMHKHFRIGHLDYEQRKHATEIIFQKHSRLDKVNKEYNSFERKHDMADAFCLAKFWLDRENQKYIKEKRHERIMNMQMVYRNSNMSMDEWFEQFRYRPK